MKRVFSSDNSAEVGFLKGVLEEAGISCFVRNETAAYTSAAPPELWILNDSDLARADELCRRWRRAEGEKELPWRCPQCGEEIEGHFQECWNCGYPGAEKAGTGAGRMDEAVVPNPSELASIDLPTQPRSTFQRRTVITVGIIVICLELVWRWGYLTPSIAKLRYPIHTALSTVGKEMMLDAAWREASTVENQLRFWNDLHRYDLATHCETILRDALAFASKIESTNTTRVHASLAVFLGETGSKQRCFKELDILLATNGNARSFVAAARAVYGTNEGVSLEWIGDPIAVLGNSWFQAKFEARWLQRIGKASEANRLNQWVMREGKKMQARHLVVVVGALLIQFVGLCALIWFSLRSKRPNLRSQKFEVPWVGWEGLGIFVVTWLIGFLLVSGMIGIGLSAIVDFGYYLMVWSPAVLLLWWRHWQWDPSSLRALVGRRSLGLVMAGFTTFAVNWLVLGGADSLAHNIGLKSHWTESLNEAELYEPWSIRWIYLLNGIIISPLGEELIYRGVLFPALQKWMTVGVAALVSGIIFAASHYYGLPGFIAITGFGIVSALSVHLTKSVIPSAISHVLTNLFLVGGFSWIYGD